MATTQTPRDAAAALRAIDRAGGLLDIAGVAQALGVDRAQALKRTRTRRFPPPLLTAGKTDLWTGAQVAEYQAALAADPWQGNGGRGARVDQNRLLTLYADGVPVRDIARELGTSANYVSVAVSRMRAQGKAVPAPRTPGASV